VNDLVSMLFRHCEWCSKPSGGELLCKTCDRMQVWAIKSTDGRYETTTERTEERTTYTEGGLLFPSEKTTRLPLCKRLGIVGRYGRKRRSDALVGMRRMRQEHGDYVRVVHWP
jgi:hypothetical protein